MFRSLSLQFITLVIPFVLVASDIKVKGTIISEGNNQPIPYANIFIKNTLIGVSSNEDGAFEMNIPSSYKGGLLCFSSIGYKKRELKINNSVLGAELTIKLKANIVTLDEVIVAPRKKLTAEEIVKNALLEYSNNFPEKPFLAKGFLRHTERTKKEYKWLVEAAIEMYDPGIKYFSENIKLNILEVRRSIDNRVLDSAMIYGSYLHDKKGLSWRKSSKISKKDGTINQLKNDISIAEVKKAIIFNDNEYSNPKKIFAGEENVLRYLGQEDAIIDKKTLKKHRFRIDSIIRSKDSDNEIYKIKILPQSPPAKLNKKYKKNLLPFGWLYIRANDFAILELEYILVNSKKNAIITDISGVRTYSKFKIKYVENKGKMYPKYLTFEKPKWNRLTLALLGDGTKEQMDDVYYYSKQEVVFTEILTEPKKSELNKTWNNDLFAPRIYHEDFWKTQNILMETLEQKRMIKELEQKIELKEQYKKNEKN